MTITRVERIVGLKRDSIEVTAEGWDTKFVFRAALHRRKSFVIGRALTVKIDPLKRD